MQRKIDWKVFFYYASQLSKMSGEFGLSNSDIGALQRIAEIN